MSSDLSPCNSTTARQAIIDAVTSAGACAVGITVAKIVDDDERNLFNDWLAKGNHADMQYMERNENVRFDPSELLPDAKTIICAAFAYGGNSVTKRSPLFADYAVGDDYHLVLREHLKPVAEMLERLVPGSATRICTDTAPIREKWWAKRAGIGFTGLNGLLIVPGAGSRVFLSEILWTGVADSDTPCTLTCAACGACIRSCPGKALNGSGTVDARKCLSYLTIEHRGELPDNVQLPGRLYGCDICQDVCPHNKNVNPYILPEFSARPELLALDTQRIETMQQEEFSSIFRHSAVKRVKLDGLRRNALRKLGKSKN